MWMVVGLFWLGAQQVSPQAQLERIEGLYRKAGHLQASFTQTYQDTALDRQQSESGRMWVSQQGQVHWRYEQPERKAFLFDGQQAYFYEPSQQQVTVFDDFAQTPLALTLKLLWGQGERHRMFRYQACQQDCPLAQGDWMGHWLYPKEPMAQVERICLYTDMKQERIVLVVLYDALGNQNSYRFEDIVLGQAMPEQHFTFTMPNNVHVLKAQIPHGPPTRPAETGKPAHPNGSKPTPKALPTSMPSHP